MYYIKKKEKEIIMNTVSNYRRIGILAKTHHHLSAAALNEIIDILKRGEYEYWLEEGCHKICREEDKSHLVKAEHLAKRIDLLIVLGGDGTFLWAARLVENTRIPIFGINLGRLGFLTEITVDEIKNSLDMLSKNQLNIEERTTLKVSLIRNGNIISEHQCLNDAVINKGAIARVIDLELKLQNESITKYKADGLIISTPTGSTAYSLSAGGSIVHPFVNAFVLTPICPHMLTQRSIIIPDNYVISVKLLTAKEEVLLTLDGQVAYLMEKDDEVMVVKNETPILIIKSPFRSYFNILREKLKWGET
jgi:NAD+ kinase